ncbi:IclR family transcriptional regulator [Falsibacillus albus]|uniref:Glycerol operon regulatory protein n=1 Tax=Falsibacillus albus TaxID=2478915 RepID=A0A3L7K275_9BACI|nr:IclR family transcriptional regulator [Falsibacillus albus]RLQ94792.1 IclR family transcriptional regulator [Falsibacillus albus]
MTENRIRAVERAFDIIECFTNRDQELSLKEISTRTDLALAVVHRNLQTLTARRYLEQDSSTGKYRLGIQFVRIAGVVIQGYNLIQKATPHLQKLSSQTEMNINLSIYDEGEALCLINFESFHHFGYEIKVGQKIPIYAGALSKVILAYLPQREIDILTTDLKTYTPITISQKEELLQDLNDIREKGYSKSEGELALGVLAFAAPVFNYEDKMVAGIAISGPKHYFTEEKKAEFLELLLMAAHDISNSLGGKQKILEWNGADNENKA